MKNKLRSILYDSMLKYFPKCIMYKQVHINSIDIVNIPRFGYSKSQKEESEGYVREYNDSIKFE